MKAYVFALALFAPPLVSACNSASDQVEESYAATEEDADEDALDSDEARPTFDEFAARERAEQEVADEGYDGPCTSDCSGHDAGFAWAADGNEDRGTSNSRSFDEGQEAFEDAVDERVEEMRKAHEDGEDEDF